MENFEMLIEFSIENFLSIKDKITLSMLASKDNSYDYHLIRPSPLRQKSLLKTTAIYGANASGKSNVLKAVFFLKSFILNSHKMQQGDEIKTTPFKLDENLIGKPSRLEIVFIFNEIKYAYGFSVDKQKVHDEYLYYFPKGRQSLIFERTNTDEYTFTIDKKEQKELSSRTPQNILYLSSATRWNYQKTAVPFEWIRKHLRVVTSHEKMSFLGFTAEMVFQNPGIIDTVNQFLLEADLGINALKVTKDATQKENTAKEFAGEWKH
ncbi:MAG: ATP-binding protein, partial [Candidatus Aminicenantes bacterium]